MKKYFFALAYLCAFSSFAGAATEEIKCHSSKILPVMYEPLPADIDLTITRNESGEVFGKLEGDYQEPDGSKTTMAEVAQRSKVDPLRIPAGIPSLDFSYSTTLTYLVERLGEKNHETKGLRLATHTLYTSTKTKSCSVVEGEEFCQEVDAPFGQFMEFRDAKGERLAAAASISGGWYMFRCE